MQDALYPAGPSRVPADLTAPSASYRRHAWLAMAGLFGFVAVYIGLLAWFVWTAYRLFSGAGGDDVLLRFLGGGFAGFLAVFMAKALFFIKRGDTPKDMELTPGEQPELFAFLHRLADEAGAPRPHRVFLSPRVNAAVFYDLSLANLLLPSRKNLEIGMGLVNVLNLGEFKAVLAHEFGHFAQRTMAVGRWVYVAQQIAMHIIAKRDALDAFLRGISSIDIRFAWIGWLLQIIVWSIRSLVELLFRVVVLAQRALSREMEYQADLVAVSLTGSDALVNALHRLHAADDAWGRAMGFAAGEAHRKHPVEDVFAVQAHLIGRLREALADPLYGQAPLVPEREPEKHRVFATEMARPPQMWSTHPANADRENNAKRTYIAADIDARPALALFRNADSLKREITRNLFAGDDWQPVALEASLAAIDVDFARPSLDRRYRGTYLGRSPFRAWRVPGELYRELGTVADLRSELDALYSAEHGDRLDRLRELEQERETLQALREGHLSAPGGVLRWRGSEVRKRDLPKVIAQLEGELEPLRRAIDDHDQRCRSLHAIAAKRFGPDWETYLRSLSALCHYAEHAEADLRDAEGLLSNTYEVVTADRRVSADELRRLTRVANDVYETLLNIYMQADQVVLDERIGVRLGASWKEILGELKLARPTEQSIGDWLRFVDGWVQGTASELAALRRASLEALLETEALLSRAIDDPAVAEGYSTQPVSAPKHYPVLTPGSERKRQTRLGWFDRFQIAEGVLPTVARFAVAASVVGGVLYVGSSIGKTMVAVYNGLSVPVVVEIDGVRESLEPFGTAMLELPADGEHAVSAETEAGHSIESFSAETESGLKYAYNVAGAAALVEWTAVYGARRPVPERKLGAKRWLATHQQHVFEEPPEQISSKENGGYRSVLGAFANVAPSDLLGLLRDEKQQRATVAAHARWDRADSPYLLEWLARASAQPGFAAMLAERVGREPDSVELRRAEQDFSVGAAHDRVCARHAAMAAAAPESANLSYLALRCRDGDPAQSEGFVRARQRWPDNPWLMLATGYVHAERQQWHEAAELMLQAVRRLPAVRGGLMVDIARVQRMSGGVDRAVLDRMTRESSYLANLLALESGQGVENTPMQSYSDLAAGRLDDCLAHAQPEPALAGRMAWLVAASDSASATLRRRPFGLASGEGIDEVTLWPALALAEREHADTQSLLQAARQNTDRESAALLRFFDSVRAGDNAAAAESAMGPVAPRVRGIAYSMGLILRGDRSPEHWRRGAKNLLFVGERPYFN